MTLFISLLRNLPSKVCRIWEAAWAHRLAVPFYSVFASEIILEAVARVTRSGASVPHNILEFVTNSPRQMDADVLLANARAVRLCVCVCVCVCTCYLITLCCRKFCICVPIPNFSLSWLHYSRQLHVIRIKLIDIKPINQILGGYL